jgi:hypothetical protein
MNQKLQIVRDIDGIDYKLIVISLGTELYRWALSDIGVHHRLPHRSPIRVNDQILYSEMILFMCPDLSSEVRITGVSHRRRRQRSIQ